MPKECQPITLDDFCLLSRRNGVPEDKIYLIRQAKSRDELLNFFEKFSCIYATALFSTGRVNEGDMPITRIAAGFETGENVIDYIIIPNNNEKEESDQIVSSDED